MSDTPKNPKKYDEIAEIFQSIDDLSTEEKLELVNQFSPPYISLILCHLVLTMTDFEKQELLDKIKDTNKDSDIHTDKRQHDRKDCIIFTDYVIKDQIHKNFVKDISEGGVFIETRDKFDVGDKLVQSFSLADEQVLFKFNGEIVRVANEGIGVKFTGLTPYQIDTLKSLKNKIK